MAKEIAKKNYRYRKYFRRNRDLYYHTMEKYPDFIKHLIDDLLKIESYSENEIAFGSGASLESVRKLANQHTAHIDRRIFHQLLNFYTRSVCGWCCYKYQPQDFDQYMVD